MLQLTMCGLSLQAQAGISDDRFHVRGGVANKAEICLISRGEAQDVSVDFVKSVCVSRIRHCRQRTHTHANQPNSNRSNVGPGSEEDVYPAILAIIACWKTP